jgi:hypothetical protein
MSSVSANAFPILKAILTGVPPNRIHKPWRKMVYPPYVSQTPTTRNNAQRLPRINMDGILDDLSESDQRWLENRHTVRDSRDLFNTQLEAESVVKLFIKCLYETVPLKFRINQDSFTNHSVSGFLKVEQLHEICTGEHLEPKWTTNPTVFTDKIQYFFRVDSTLYAELNGKRRKPAGWTQLMKYITRHEVNLKKSMYCPVCGPPYVLAVIDEMFKRVEVLPNTTTGQKVWAARSGKLPIILNRINNHIRGRV